MNYIKTFDQINKNDVLEIGGKGASLGEMINMGIPVPPGFVITTKTYKNFYNQEIPIEIREDILKAFDKLGLQRIAVRSSAVAEDSSNASWAGQLESYLNVGRDDLIEKIRECWNSIRSERALAYASEQNLPKDKLIVAVVVQKMIESQVSGVMFTANPVNKDRNEIMIEAGWGLGELLVQGMITPDNFVLDKKTLQVKTRDIQTQETMLVFQDGENKEISVSKDKQSKQKLTEEQLADLAKLGIKIENHYKAPQDIEWAIDNAGKIWIVQSRPITTL